MSGDRLDGGDHENSCRMVVKRALGTICRDVVVLETLSDAALRMDRIVTETYQLLNLHVRRLLEAGLEVPPLDKNYLQKFALAVSHGERPGKLPPELAPALELYRSTRPPDHVVPSRCGLSHAITDACVEMSTAIRNNIAVHFFARQLKHLRYVDEDAPPPNTERREIAARQQQINEEAANRDDLDELTLPSSVGVSVAYDLVARPWAFLQPMWRMRRAAERLYELEVEQERAAAQADGQAPRNVRKRNNFALLPLRRGFVPRFFAVDTETLCLLFSGKSDKLPKQHPYRGAVRERKKARKTKKEQRDQELDRLADEECDRLPDATERDAECARIRQETVDKKRRLQQDEPMDKLPERTALWYSLFDDLKLHMGSGARWTFAFRVQTDGVSAAIHYVRTDASVAGVLTHKKAKLDDGDGGKPKVKYKPKQKRKRADERQPTAEPLLPPLPDLIGRVVVGVDPGMVDLISCTSDDATKTGARLRYTAVQRRKEGGAKRAARLRRKMLERDPTAKAAQATLGDSDSRDSRSDRFADHLRKQGAAQEPLLRHYAGDRQYRTLRWSCYRHRQRSEARLVRNMKQKFGDRAVLAYGAWVKPSAFAIKGTVGGPGVGLRRMLAKHFTVVVVPEYHTTETCHRCLRLDQVGKMCPMQSRPSKSPRYRRLPEEKKPLVDVRALRRCQNEKCGVWMNRDYNAALNIRANLMHRLAHGRYHPAFASRRHQAITESDEVADEPSAKQVRIAEPECVPARLDVEFE
ncbi:Hypothetical protein UVM_LOCUS231 [uncultured virus]|nr:Hypothetical protein UVM_LOCUS231 [uncultured virus]